jgi:hypothetical protein
MSNECQRTKLDSEIEDPELVSGQGSASRLKFGFDLALEL